MDNQQRAASTPPQTPDPGRRHTQPPSLSALATARTGCGVTRCPASSSISGAAYRPYHRCRCRNLSPHCHRTHGQWSATACMAERALHTFDAGGAPGRLLLPDTLATVPYPKSVTFQIFFGRRGALRISCCGAHTATQAQVDMLAGSCWERAHLRGRSQTVTLCRLLSKSMTAVTLVPFPSTAESDIRSNLADQGSRGRHTPLPLGRLGS